MIACVSQVCSLPSSFADDVTGYAGGGCRAIEVWLTKLEQHLETTPADDTRKLLADNGVTVPTAAYHGGLLLSVGDARTAALDHFKRRLDLCQTFGIQTLLLAADHSRPDAANFGRVVASLAEAGRWAAGFGVRLALEFRGINSVCTSLDTAVALTTECGEPNVGVCLDVFHYHQGPSKAEDLNLLTPANLFHVQVCDVAGVPRELMTDSDRVLPGEGDFHLTAVIDRLRAIGYAGAVSAEVMNPVLWKAKAAQVGELALASVQRFVSG
ncbi:MAG: sugar phosphate isomerase/epimerase [Fimbriiglobus sp.]|jgi:4-hydroxyphenylpyruvate dioxygenase|nr:sugar phosphate isomerase/epimerase [Fimbriiglobus sp.]